MNFEECMKFIGSYSRLGGRVKDLSRAKELMQRIGNPQEYLKFVHIAGTNGKGSTTEYIAKALELSGYKTGVLTSPYVTHYTDRIKINSSDIDEKSLGEICEFVAENAADREYSQFEITMAIAFLWYAREKCDIVVLETGIGGLLDSTNVITTNEAAVITSISLDHTAILGDTVEEIALQKVGIIKQGSYAVLSADNMENVREIFQKKCCEMNNSFIIAKKSDIILKSTEINGNAFVYKGEEYRTAMAGVHQVYNAVTAIETCGILRAKGYEIPVNALKSALLSAKVAARIQYFAGDPPIIVDGGHNVAGVTALAEVLKKYPRDKVFAVLGMVEGKDYIHSAEIIASSAENIYCVNNFSDYSIPADVLADCLSTKANIKLASLSEAVKNAEIQAKKCGGLVVVCGSLYLAGEYLNYRKNIHKTN